MSEESAPTRKSGQSARQADLDRYERIVDLQRQLNREPSLDEMFEILHRCHRLKTFARICPTEGKPESADEAPRNAVRKVLRNLRARVGAIVGAQAIVAGKLGVVADKAVAALDEQLDPATRSSDPRMVKAVFDGAAKTLEIAGHSREEKAPGSQTVVNVGVTKEESVALLRANERIHQLERAATGIPGNRLEA